MHHLGRLVRRDGDVLESVHSSGLSVLLPLGVHRRFLLAQLDACRHQQCIHREPEAVQRSQAEGRGRAQPVQGQEVIRRSHLGESEASRSRIRCLRARPGRVRHRSESCKTHEAVVQTCCREKRQRRSREISEVKTHGGHSVNSRSDWHVRSLVDGSLHDILQLNARITSN